MEGFGQLDKWTIGRIENTLGTEITTRLKQAIIQVVNELEDDYPPEDIYDYVRGILIEQLEDEED
jgi:hypothetical protein